MATCEWDMLDCKFLGTEKCDTCFVYQQNYRQIKNKTNQQLASRQQKASKRIGSNFEYKNHQSNVEVLSDKVVSGMTLNSGATVLEKGDEQIRGLIRVMEELKTKVTQKTQGKKNFTIQKSWLEKLHREAKEADMEFWYLKFSFLENDRDVYVVVEQDIIMSMIKTMVEDRKKAIHAYEKEKSTQKLYMATEAENIALRKKISYYEQLEEARQLEQKLNDYFEVDKDARGGVNATESA